MKKKYVLKNCDKCNEKFLSHEEKLCLNCNTGKSTKITGMPMSTDYHRLGDNHFKQGSNEWKDLLRKIKKENPGSTIEVT